MPATLPRPRYSGGEGWGEGATLRAGRSTEWEEPLTPDPSPLSTGARGTNGPPASLIERSSASLTTHPRRPDPSRPDPPRPAPGRPPPRVDARLRGLAAQARGDHHPCRPDARRPAHRHALAAAPPAPRPRPARRPRRRRRRAR